MEAGAGGGNAALRRLYRKSDGKALKTSESMPVWKRIVAAPTAGSCGVVPAVF